MIAMNEMTYVGDHAEGEPRPLAPSMPPPAPAPARASSSLLARLLKIADGYRAEGGLRQAIEMYFELVEGHADAAEAEQARERLLAVGEHYERGGEFRQARSIYERLF